MKIVTINNQEFNIHGASRYEIEEAIKLIPESKKKITQKDIDSAIKTFRESIEVDAKVKEYTQYLKNTSYLMTSDILEALSKDEQNNLINTRKEAIVYIITNKGSLNV
jgi:hypothetical protein